MLALKGNHPKLCQAVEQEFSAAVEAAVPPRGLRRQVTVKPSHGREERRDYFALPAPATLPGFADWKSLATIVMVLRVIVVNGQEQGEVCYFVSSLLAKVRTLAKRIRQYWSIGNQLHWVLDVDFTENDSQIRKQNAPQTAAMLRRLAASILSLDTSIKDNLTGKRYRVSLSTEVLERIFHGFVMN